MNNELLVREAHLADSEAVYPLAKMMATSFKVEKTDFELSFQEIIAQSSSSCLIAEKGDEVIGYLIGFDHRAFYANGRVSWVEEIFVKEEHRKLGIGKRLMLGFEQWCTDRNSKLVALATRRASDFYHAIGYEDSATFFRKLITNNTKS